MMRMMLQGWTGAGARRGQRWRHGGWEKEGETEPSSVRSVSLEEFHKPTCSNDWISSRRHGCLIGLHG
jgi:hypothetical protein